MRQQTQKKSKIENFNTSMFQVNMSIIIFQLFFFLFQTSRTCTAILHAIAFGGRSLFSLPLS